MPTTEDGVIKSLSFLETEFFDALQNGSDALMAFHSAWRAFNMQVEECIDRLQEDTRSKIYSFASIANIVTSTLLDVTLVSDDLHHQLHEDITKVVREEFSELTIHDKQKRITGNAAYIPLAYKWLLDNLCNPYPSKATRLEISISTNSQLKDVDAWFIDARKRIGWNRLRKEHFPRRSDLIRAATLFFQPAHTTGSTSTTLSSTATDFNHLNFANQFVQMEECARELYSNKLFPSNLASDLGNNTTNMHNSDNAEFLNYNLSSLDGREFYPSPESSPGRSVSPSLSPPQSKLKHGNKRKRTTSSSLPTSDYEESFGNASRFFKRSRFEVSSEDMVTSLPSPAASLCDTANGESLSTTVTFQQGAAQSSLKRKRSLSDIGQLASKRPSAAQPQNVSFPTTTVVACSTTKGSTCIDDLPLPQLLDSGFQFNTDIPTPVSETGIDESAVFDISLHSYDLSNLLTPEFVDVNSQSSATSPSNFNSHGCIDDVNILQSQSADCPFWLNAASRSENNIEKSCSPFLWNSSTSPATMSVEQGSTLLHGDLLPSANTDIRYFSIQPEETWRSNNLSHDEFSLLQLPMLSINGSFDFSLEIPPTTLLWDSYQVAEI